MKTARVVNSAGGCCFIDVHCVGEGNSCFFSDLSGQVNTVYGLVSYNYEFLGDIESRASLGDKSARMERSLDGGWFSYGIGAQANISKIWSAYGELERTSGGDVENPWRWGVGVRHVF